MRKRRDKVVFWREEGDVGDLDEDFMGVEICWLGLGEVMAELEDVGGGAAGCVCPGFHCGVFVGCCG